MASPPIYNRLTSFSNYQALFPTAPPPGNSLDAEFNSIQASIAALISNINLIQNSDTTLGTSTVGPAQLSSQLTTGFTAPSAWVTGQAYTASPASTVLQGTAMYICLVSHTSGTFTTDLANGDWLKIFDLSTLTFGAATAISVSSDGGLVSGNVQTSLAALDSGKAATTHTHTSSQISDSTTAGRAMLIAANVAAQQALLGLGSLAYLNSFSVNSISGQLAFPTKLTPTALGANTNDFTPTGWATAAVLWVSSSANYNLTGLGATTDGDVKFVQNTGSFDITLTANDTNSASANRLLLPRPLLLRPNQGIFLKYSNNGSGYQGWTAMSPVPTNPVVGGFKNLRVGNITNYLGDSAPSAPNNQAYLIADELVLEDPTGETWRLQAVSVTPDGTVQNAANGTDGAYTIGASAWYSLWVIGNPVSNTVAGLISTSATAPTLPTGYTFKARVGWIRTDGSSHFLKTLQYGRTARYVAAAALPTMASGNVTVTVAVANFIPSTAVKIGVVLQAVAATTGAASVSPNNLLTSPPLAIAGNTNGGVNIMGELLLESGNIYYSSTIGGAVLTCSGWEDNL